MMGGKVAHEFMLLCDAGEDTVFKCAGCDYLANADVAVGRVQAFPEPMRELQKVHTPAMKTIEEVAAFLKVETRRTAKVVFYESDSEGRPVMAILRGDLAVNEAKLARLLLRPPALAEEATIRKAGAVPGFASTLGVSGRFDKARAALRDLERAAAALSPMPAPPSPATSSAARTRPTIISSTGT